MKSFNNDKCNTLSILRSTPCLEGHTQHCGIFPFETVVCHRQTWYFLLETKDFLGHYEVYYNFKLVNGTFSWKLPLNDFTWLKLHVKHHKPRSTLQVSTLESYAGCTLRWAWTREYLMVGMNTIHIIHKIIHFFKTQICALLLVF